MKNNLKVIFVNYIFILKIISLEVNSNKAMATFIASSVIKELDLGCEDDVIFWSFGDTTSFMDVHSEMDDFTKEISYKNLTEFLGFKFSEFGKHIPACFVFVIGGNESNLGNLSQIIRKINEDFRTLSILDWKPTLVFIGLDVTSQVDDEISQLERLLKIYFQNIGFNFKIDTDVYLIFIHNDEEYKNKRHYSLWEMYFIKSKIFFKMLRITYLLEDSSLLKKDENGVQHQLINRKVIRRSNFEGEIIVCSLREYQPDWMRFELVNGQRKLQGGFSINLYWDLQTMLNFSEGSVIGDGLMTLPNNTLGGLTVSQLNSGVADISLSQSSIVPFRASQLTFLQPTYYGIINVFFKQPSANSIRNIVTAPFHTYLWISLISTWIILIAVVKISSYLKMYCVPTEYLIPEQNDNGVAFEFEDLDIEFSNQIGMWAFAANCQKSWHLIPSSVPMRMIFILGIFCGVVSYVAYSGAIVSTLAVSIVPVNQVLDLITFKFTFTVHEKSEPFHIFLKEMIDYYKLGQSVLKIKTEEEITHLTNPEKPKAFLTYPDLFYQAALGLNYSETFICHHVSKVRVSDFSYKSGMFLTKGSEFREIFNHKLIILKERGFNYRYMQKYERKNVVSCLQQDEKATVSPVVFTDVFTAFLVIIIGFLGSFILICLEYIFGKFKESRGGRLA